MTRHKTIAATFLIALFVCTGNVYATDISGIITTTLTITDNSKLVGDVVCTVTPINRLKRDSAQTTP